MISLSIRLRLGNGRAQVAIAIVRLPRLDGFLLEREPVAGE